MQLRDVADRVSTRISELTRASSMRAAAAALALLALLALGAWWWLEYRRAARNREVANYEKSVKASVRRKPRPPRQEAPELAPLLEPEQSEPTPVALAPEVARLYALVKAFETESDDPAQGWNALIAIGDIYRRGAFPRLLPDDELAAEVYAAAAASPDGEVAGMAQARFVEAREQRISPQDRMGVPLPSEPAERAVAEARRRTQLLSMRGGLAGAQRPRAVRRAEEARRRGGRENTDGGPPPITARPTFGGAEFEELGALARAALQAPNAAAEAPGVPAPAPELSDPRSDPQNVHDHGVVSSTRRLLGALPPVTPDVSAGVVHQVRSALTKMRSDERISAADAKAAEAVLARITDAPNVGMGGISEREALARVWQRIAETPAAETAESLREILARQLASGLEHGHVVCSTGKITRIASVFDGVDGALEGAPEAAAAAANARPLWVVREELASLAARVRDEYLEGLSAGERAVYDAGGDAADGRHEAAMRARFEDAARAEYVDKLSMSEAVIAPLVAEMAEGF